MEIKERLRESPSQRWFRGGIHSFIDNLDDTMFYFHYIRQIVLLLCI